MSHKTIKKILYGYHTIKLRQFLLVRMFIDQWGWVLENVSYRRYKKLGEESAGDHIHTNTHVTPLPLAHLPREVTPRLGNTLIDIN